MAPGGSPAAGGGWEPDYVVPCSTQSQFPDLWSAPLRCAHWMPILGDPGAHAVGVPSRHATPERTTGKPSPISELAAPLGFSVPFLPPDRVWLKVTAVIPY